jgi:hypothetical protein
VYCTILNISAPGLLFLGYFDIYLSRMIMTIPYSFQSNFILRTCGFLFRYYNGLFAQEKKNPEKKAGNWLCSNAPA